MRIAVLGSGAMGSVIGGHMALAGLDVTLLDVARDHVETIRKDGLRLDDKSGESRRIPVKASWDPAEVGRVDLVLVFVKCYHTEAAVRGAGALLGPGTSILSLQNGWGNAPRIAGIAGEERVLAGVTYHSATVLGPGHILHAGKGKTVFGEIDGGITDRVRRIEEAFRASGLEVEASGQVLGEIWKKLALNCATLPTTSLLRFFAGQLVEHEGTLNLMRAILAEVVRVAAAQDISISEEERWETITSLLRRAAGAKSSMLQDVENRRRTEIDVVNGAIVEAGRRLDIPTPFNDAMVWLIRSLESTFPGASPP
jgi:2-dehydropantoate 2-reductase